LPAVATAEGGPVEVVTVDEAVVKVVEAVDGAEDADVDVLVLLPAESLILYILRRLGPPQYSV
jgi:hypothetical protein